MRNFLNKLADIPRQKLIALAVGSFVAIGLLFWLFLLKSIYQDTAILKTDISDLEEQIIKESTISKNLNVYREEFDELEKKLNLVMLELPDKKDIENFLESVSVLATDNGLEVIKFAPRSTIIKDFYAEVPADIELQGTFHQVASFFDEVGHLPRIINIKDINGSIVKELNSEVIIRVQCKAVTFRYLDAKEQAEVDREKKKNKKRR